VNKPRRQPVFFRRIVSAVIAISALTVVAPVGHADPPACPPDARSCPAADQALIADMTGVGIDQDPIHQSPGGLISGARNTVCPSLDGGEPQNSVAADLKKYSGFNDVQASTYIRDAVTYYCPSDAAKVSPASPGPSQGSCPGEFVLPSVNPDCYFLNMMARDHISGNSDALISEAHTACGDMANDAGADPVLDAATNVQRDEPSLTISQAALFAGLAAAAYCPSSIRH
jgi:hypothetical protein